MSKIKGIYAASLSIFDENLKLDIKRTIQHAEMLINQGCHGVAIFGSTGQAQLISIAEKIDLLNNLTQSKYRDKFLIGTGLNSLGETINFMKVALTLKFKKFLIMPPAYYKYNDSDVIEYYSKIIEQIPQSEIVLYNFEKLCGYKFSVECVQNLVKKFPKQIIGVKDSSYNLYESLKIKDFSILPGSELKLLNSLKLGCSGIITATCNVTASLARQVYDDHFSGKDSNHNKKLCDVRRVFDQFNLISAIHTFLSNEDKVFQNVIPPLSLLKNSEKQKLEKDLKDLNFSINTDEAA